MESLVLLNKIQVFGYTRFYPHDLLFLFSCFYSSENSYYGHLGYMTAFSLVGAQQHCGGMYSSVCSYSEHIVNFQLVIKACYNCWTAACCFTRYSVTMFVLHMCYYEHGIWPYTGWTSLHRRFQLFCLVHSGQLYSSSSLCSDDDIEITYCNNYKYHIFGAIHIMLSILNLFGSSYL